LQRLAAVSTMITLNDPAPRSLNLLNHQPSHNADTFQLRSPLRSLVKRDADVDDVVSPRVQLAALASRLPFCIGRNVTLKQYHAKCDRNESNAGSRWEYKNGEVWIYEVVYRVLHMIVPPGKSSNG
jgi:hypothetical protein